MTRCEGLESMDGEILLPEEVIHHIQSYMSTKEAARTALLSKSWHDAWLNRPELDFNYGYFNRYFAVNTGKTMQRYQDLNLKIRSFKLHNNSSYEYIRCVIPILIVKAMKIGATDVQLEIKRPSRPLTLPKEVLGSETLQRLSLTGFIVNRTSLESCSRLKSISLEHVDIINDDVFKDIISCCISIEELSLSHCTGLASEQMNLFELHKLRRLYLDSQYIDNIFFTRLSSRFPFLKDVSILQCHGCTRVRIASTSLQIISFMPVNGSQGGKFDVPNIRKFTYSGHVLPSFLFIEGASQEWVLDILISCDRFHKTHWFLKLKKELTRFRLSRISLALILNCVETSYYWHEVDIEVVPKPLVVENLMVGAPTTFRSALMVRLVGIFHPKFITDHHWLSAHCDLWSEYKVAPIDIFGKRLIQLIHSSYCQKLFMRLGLKRVNVEVYESFGTVWRPIGLEELEASKTPANYEKIRLQLIWEEYTNARLS